jgi:hypothetical protein
MLTELENLLSKAKPFLGEGKLLAKGEITSAAVEQTSKRSDALIR